MQIIIQRKQSEIDAMDAQHTAAIEIQEAVINKALNEIKQVIQDIKSLLDPSDVGLVFKYRSRFEEFKNCHLNLRFPFRTFCLRRSTERSY